MLEKILQEFDKVWAENTPFSTPMFYDKIKQLISFSLQKVIKAEREKIIELGKALLNNSEKISFSHECQQEGYEYGIEDFIKQINKL